MADKPAKGGKRLVNRGKRHLQNLRTYARVQRRRAVHALNHGVTVESLGAIRWNTPPVSKAQGKLV